MARRVLVTGGGRPLGRMIAKTCAEAGWQPVIHDDTPGADTNAFAQALGGVSIDQPLDEARAAERLITRAAEMAGGPLDALVNAASFVAQDTAQTVTEASLLQNFRANAMEPLLLARHFAAQAPRSSVIVNLVDHKGTASAGHFSYAWSHEALRGVTSSLATAYAPHIRVVAVSPASDLIGQQLDPGEVDRAVLFAMTNKAITGQVLMADGGKRQARPKTQLAD